MLEKVIARSEILATEATGEHTVTRVVLEDTYFLLYIILVCESHTTLPSHPLISILFIVLKEFTVQTPDGEKPDELHSMYLNGHYSTVLHNNNLSFFNDCFYCLISCRYIRLLHLERSQEHSRIGLRKIILYLEVAKGMSDVAPINSILTAQTGTGAVLFEHTSLVTRK